MIHPAFLIFIFSTDFEEALHSCGNCSKGPDVADTYKSVEVKSLRSLICRKLSHAYVHADFTLKDIIHTCEDV